MSAGAGIYDEVAYPTLPHAFAFPAAFGALAQLCGARGVVTRDYRALEFGCGSAEHLLALAIDAPESRFEGVDFSLVAIAAARGLRDRAGLAQVELRVADLTDVEIAPSSVDYIVAHGLYAWTPHPVRDALLRLIASSLRPGGLAAVSFNVMPGCAPRLALREHMLANVEGLGPHARIEKARAALASIVVDAGQDEVLRSVAQRLLDRDHSALLHDDLADCYAPATLPDFAAHAAAHGLACVCDADAERLPDALRPRPQALWLEAEIERDRAEGVPFRRMILARAQDFSARGFAPANLRGLCACADLAPHPSLANTWSVVNGGRIATQDRVLARWLAALAEQGGVGLPLDDLAGDYDDRVETLLQLIAAGVVEPRTRPRAHAAMPGECPRASPLVAAELAMGRTSVCSLRGGRIEMDARSRSILASFDGGVSLGEAARRAGLPLEAVAAEARSYAALGLLDA